MSAPRSRKPIERCCAKWTPSTATSAPADFARATRSAAGVTVPTPLDASVNATMAGPSVRASSNDSRSSVASSGCRSTHRTVAPASRAARTHGRTFASWSSLVTTTVSPGPIVRANDRDRWSSNEVELAPNTIWFGSAPTRSAPALRAAAASSSVSSLTTNAPSMLLIPSRYRRLTASITVSGTWEPPGASANTTGRPSWTRDRAGNRLRTAAKSSSVAHATYTPAGRALRQIAGRTMHPNGEVRMRFGLDIAQHQLTWDEIVHRARAGRGRRPGRRVGVRSFQGALRRPDGPVAWRPGPCSPAWRARPPRSGWARW